MFFVFKDGRSFLVPYDIIFRSLGQVDKLNTRAINLLLVLLCLSLNLDSFTTLGSWVALGPPHTLRAPAFDRKNVKQPQNNCQKTQKNTEHIRKQLNKNGTTDKTDNNYKNKTKNNAPRRGAQQSMGRAPPNYRRHVRISFENGGGKLQICLRPGWQPPHYRDPDMEVRRWRSG